MMRQLTNDEKKLLSILIKESYYEDVKLQQLEETVSSHTTNSYYLAFSDEKGDVYQISFSDHYSHIHGDRFENLDLDNIDELTESLIDSFDLTQNNTNYLLAPEIDLEFYGVTKAQKYEIDPKSLIGKKSYNRAWVSGDFEIKDAKLECNNQILVCDYDLDTEIYLNYDPTEDSKGKSDEDFILANYMRSNEISRSKIYKYDVVSIDDYCEEWPMMTNGEVTSEQAKKDEMWYEDDYFEEIIDEKWLVLYDQFAEPQIDYNEDAFGDDYY